MLAIHLQQTKNLFLCNNINAMRTKKKFTQQMNATFLLLALACANGYAQDNKSSNSESSKEEGN